MLLFASASLLAGPQRQNDTLVNRYGVCFKPSLRDEVVARYRRLDIPTCWAGINAGLAAETSPDGRHTRVELRHPRNVLHQYLSYAAMHNPGLAGAVPAGRER